MIEVPVRRRVRILDVGCGSGALIAYLQQTLPVLELQLEIELYGLDVIDHGVQEDGFFTRTLESLQGRAPGVDWAERLSAITIDAPWPFADGFFDMVISNQVLEHVRDHQRFFSEVERTLRLGGCSFHLFPVRESVVDGHLRIQWVLRMLNFDLLRSYIHACSRFGLGCYNRRSGETSENYAERHADYMLQFTNYPTYRNLLQLGSAVGLRCSFRYTKEYYRLKLRSLLRCPDRRTHYREPHSAWGDFLLFHGLKSIASITLFLEKKQVYRSL
jgi:SAM-dependent methyltransferase